MDAGKILRAKAGKNAFNQVVRFFRDELVG